MAAKTRKTRDRGVGGGPGLAVKKKRRKGETAPAADD